MHSEEFDIGLGNNDSSIRSSAKNDYISFWDNCAKSLSWFKPWTKTLQWDPPFARWFVGGKINASYNTLDIHQVQNLKNQQFCGKVKMELTEKLHTRDVHRGQKTCKCSKIIRCEKR